MKQIRSIGVTVLFVALSGVVAGQGAPVLNLETVDITLNLEPKPYSFTFGSPRLGQATSTIIGRRFDNDTGATLTIEIARPKGSSKIGSVTANVMGPSVDAAAWLLPYVASAPIEGGQPQKASAWVKTNWRRVRTGKPLEKTFGPAVYEIAGNAETFVFLRIKHPKFAAWALSQTR